MKNYGKYYILVWVTAVLLMVQSCKNDTYIVPKVVITTPVSFDTIIVPILTTNCAISGCHVGGAQAPDLTAGNAYTNIWSYALVDTASGQQATSLLYEHITGTGGQQLMPPSGSLSPTQIGDFMAWITQGAQDN